MYKAEVIANFQEMVKNIKKNISDREYEGMRAGILVAVAFLKARYDDGSITPGESVHRMAYLRDTVFLALTTE